MSSLGSADRYGKPSSQKLVSYTPDQAEALSKSNGQRRVAVEKSAKTASSLRSFQVKHETDDINHVNWFINALGCLVFKYKFEGLV